MQLHIVPLELVSLFPLTLVFEDTNTITVYGFHLTFCYRTIKKLQIDERVQASVERLGIHTIRKCHLAAWHQVGNRVESLDFMTPLTAISLKSFAVFYYGIQAINLHAFKGRSHQDNYLFGAFGAASNLYLRLP